MRLSNLSFLSGAERLTLMAYHAPRQSSVIISEVISRLAALILLSPGAALDLVFHSALILPACTFAIGKSIYQRKADFHLPWEHLQRIRNAVTPLLFGSLFGMVHPFAGLTISEPTDKHIVLGILSSHTSHKFVTPCSPIHSLALIEETAQRHRFVEKDGNKREIFSEEDLQIIRELGKFEASLECLQAQEYIHKITNVTLVAMDAIRNAIYNTRLNPLTKEIAVRVSGVLIPVLTAVDMTIAILAQTFFLATGIAQLISGRGPIYTEVTTNPIMHLTFLIQNLLKVTGNLVGTGVWFISPMTGFRVSLLPATLFFKMQMNLLMSQIKTKMDDARDNTRFALPIVFGQGVCSAFSVPTHSMHKTYLIIEKKNHRFNLYWVNRPTVSIKLSVDSEAALAQIRLMFEERFPFMNIDKMLNYPVQSTQPDFPAARNYANIAAQGNETNCVVSNLFGMFEALDKIRHKPQEVTRWRYTAMRAILTKNYEFYKDGFFPFTYLSSGFSLKDNWNEMQKYPQAVI